MSNRDCRDRFASRASMDGMEQPSLGLPKFPLLESYQLANIDLSNEAQNQRFQRLLGEMIAKQQQHSGNKNVITYFKPQQNRPTSAVALQQHKSEESYNKYHYRNPYLADVVACLEPNDKKVGARRLSYFLATQHQKEFVDAANASGVAVCGVLDETESASLFYEAKLTDAQWNTIMRHLRHKFHAKIAVSKKKRAGVNDVDIQEQCKRTKRSRGPYKKS